jgi:hypothetical protein
MNLSIMMVGVVGGGRGGRGVQAAARIRCGKYPTNPLLQATLLLFFTPFLPLAFTPLYPQRGTEGVKRGNEGVSPNGGKFTPKWG